MSETIGFIGLGIMGQGMALCLLKAGYRVAVYNRSVEKAEAVEQQGARVAPSPKSLAGEAGVIITMLSDTAAVEAVLFGPDGVESGAKAGSIVIDMSTIAPAGSKAFADRLRARQVAMLDAPVLGSKQAAATGSLTIMVGGSRSVFDRVEPILKVMGQRVFYVGLNGAGSTIKLANNLISIGNIQLISEAFLMGVRAGVDPAVMQQVLACGGARSNIMDAKLPKMLKGDYTPTFYLRHATKDLALARHAGEELGVPMPLTQLTHTLYLAATGAGKGDLDMSAILAFWEDLLGTQVRANPA